MSYAGFPHATSLMLKLLGYYYIHRFTEKRDNYQNFLIVQINRLRWQHFWSYFNPPIGGCDHTQKVIRRVKNPNLTFSTLIRVNYHVVGFMHLFIHRGFKTFLGVFLRFCQFCPHVSRSCHKIPFKTRTICLNLIIGGLGEFVKANASYFGNFFNILEFPMKSP